MKTTFTLGLLVLGFISSAHGQVTTKIGDHYREYQMRAAIANGEVKTAILQVNQEVSAFNPMGDTAHRGDIRYSVTGSVVEGDKTCNFDLYVGEYSNERQLTTAEIIKSSIDSSGTLSLCSGVILDLGSVKTLLKDATMTVAVRVPELSKAIGTGFITFTKIKEVLPPADQPDDLYEKN